MSEVERQAPGEIRRRATAAGQAHVIRQLERLEGAAHARLAAQLAKLDFELVRQLGQLLRVTDSASQPRFEPPEVFPLARDAAQEARAAEARERGQALLAGGEVGFLLVAGGQGSRLGLEGPKGAFPIGPVSGRTLFEFHARRLLAARRRYGVATPWYVMTSRANHAQTQRIFEAADHFGLEPGEVHLFEQAMLPALDPSGKILFASEDSLFLAPDGHGGVLAALSSSGALADARARGVNVFSFFQVDNPLVRPADPLFLGLHSLAGAEMSSKVVTKRDAGEKVGVLGRADGRLGCIEYSDLPRELRDATSDDGQLMFRAGNIAVHAIQRSFVEQLTRGGLKLPWHVARKKVRALDDRMQPTERDGVKFETFVFDSLGLARESLTLEVDRREEFSPVKNAQGADSPATSRKALCDLHAGWVRAAGLPLPAEDVEGARPVEIDPLLAEERAEFLARVPIEAQVSERGHLFTP